MVASFTAIHVIITILISSLDRSNTQLLVDVIITKASTYPYTRHIDIQSSTGNYYMSISCIYCTRCYAVTVIFDKSTSTRPTPRPLVDSSRYHHQHMYYHLPRSNRNSGHYLYDDDDSCEIIDADCLTVYPSAVAFSFLVR